MITNIDLNLIDPSPFQHRKDFNTTALKELGANIERDGQVQPVSVRKLGDRYELIAGERRFRAIRDYTGADTIRAEVCEVDDVTARRRCASENLQRQDLSHIEEVGAIVEMVDAEMIDDDEYRALGDDPEKRVGVLLKNMHAEEKQKSRGVAQEDVGKFTDKVDAIFANLPRPIKWDSFRRNDLPLVVDLDEDVARVAIANKLNKSQTKALDNAVKETPEIKEKLAENADEDGKIEVGVDDDGEAENISDMSAKEIKRDISWRLEESEPGDLRRHLEEEKAAEVSRRVKKERIFAFIQAMRYWASLPLTITGHTLIHLSYRQSAQRTSER